MVAPPMSTARSGPILLSAGVPHRRVRQRGLVVAREHLDRAPGGTRQLRREVAPVACAACRAGGERPRPRRAVGARTGGQADDGVARPRASGRIEQPAGDETAAQAGGRQRGVTLARVPGGVDLHGEQERRSCCRRR